MGIEGYEDTSLNRKKSLKPVPAGTTRAPVGGITEPSRSQGEGRELARGGHGGRKSINMADTPGILIRESTGQRDDSFPGAHGSSSGEWESGTSDSAAKVISATLAG